MQGSSGSHAYRGQTPRNTPMFAHAGAIYVYFTYGMHWMLNLVCEGEGFPAAVLIRGVASPAGAPPLDGPAKLTKYLHIDRSLTGKRLGKRAGLWVEDRGVRVRRSEIVRTPRVGIPDRGIWTAEAVAVRDGLLVHVLILLPDFATRKPFIENLHGRMGACIIPLPIHRGATVPTDAARGRMTCERTRTTSRK